MNSLELGKVLWQDHLRDLFLAIDPERALNTVLDVLEQSASNPMSLELSRYLYCSTAANTPVTIGNKNCHIVWRNRVGIPAGFTKYAFGLRALNEMGVGAIEIGTCTPEPQPGNPQPRFFIERRGNGDLILVNRFGFNHTGIRKVVHSVQSLWDATDQGKFAATLIWSLGPNKKTVDQYEESRDLSLIVNDILYMVVEVMSVLRAGDAFQFNIASPNTPGPRDLFEHFGKLINGIIEQTRMLARIYRRPSPPWIIKLSPDMSSEQMRQVAQAATCYEEVVALEGFNTTADDNYKAQYGVAEKGGMSGDPLRILADNKLITLHEIVMEEKLDIDIIAVGGIMTPNQAVDRLLIGERVKAVQLFSGIIKNGFSLIPETLEAIANISV